MGLERAVPSWLLERPLAHRGLHDLAAGVPENSIAAFATAADAGAPVELDVHLSADGHPVVVHDDDLERLCGVARRVAGCDLAELTGLAILGTTERIPSLADVLDAIAGRVGIMVEIKSRDPRAVGALEAAVATALDTYDGPVCIASFNPRTVGWFRTQRPEVVRGQTWGLFTGVTIPRWVRYGMGSLATNWWTRPDFLSYELAGLPNPTVAAWRRRGLPVIAWTVKDEADRAKAKEHADNYIYEGLSA